MRAADHIVDMGPGAGEHGGHVVAEGTAQQVEAVAESLTGQFLAGTRTIEVPAKRRTPSGYIQIQGASENNLRGIDVKVPLGVLCSVTGVSGSGKSTLVNEVLLKSVANHLHRTRVRAGAHKKVTGLEQLDKIISVDQSPIVLRMVACIQCGVLSGGTAQISYRRDDDGRSAKTDRFPATEAAREYHRIGISFFTEPRERHCIG